VIGIAGIYQPAPKDLTGLTLEWRSEFLSVSATATLLTGNLGVPVQGDRVWNLTSFAIEVSPGTGQFALVANLVEQFADAALGVDRIICTFDALHPRSLVAGAFFARSQQLNYYARPGSQLQVRATVDVAVNPSQFTATVGGLMIPRANIQFVG
jgi:hypothetical protein